MIVFGDAKELQLLLETEFPNASIRVRPLQSSVVLSGWVDGPEVISRVVRMAEDYYPSVINNIRVGDNQQVMLHTRVMEVSRTKLRQLGFDWSAFGGSEFIAQTVSGLIQETTENAGAVAGTGLSSVTFGIINANNQFFGVLDALKQNNLVKTLAEPVLTTVSGRPAVFNSGGEFPILVPQGNQQVTIVFKTFGTRVDFVPTVLGNGNIRLEVRPQVSELDNAQGVAIDGTIIPGIRNRWVDTAVEMRAGQTLALAGLIQEVTETQIIGIPWLSDLPWVGAIFRRVQDQTNEIELLIMVRPELVAALDPEQVPLFGPGEQTVVASDTELYFRGYIEVPACCPDGSCVKCRPGEGEYAIPVDNQRVEFRDRRSAARGYGPDSTTHATTPTTMPFGLRPPSPQNVKQPQSNEKNNVPGFNKAFGLPAPVYRKVSDKTPVAPTIGRTKPGRPVTPIERGHSGSSDPGLFGQIGYDVLD